MIGSFGACLGLELELEFMSYVFNSRCCLVPSSLVNWNRLPCRIGTLKEEWNKIGGTEFNQSYKRKRKIDQFGIDGLIQGITG